MTIRDAKLNFIIDVATQLFFEHPIRSVTVRDIAARAGIGEVTVYRYFGRKETLVNAVAEKLQRHVYQTYFVPAGGNGYERICAFFGAYTEIFRNHPEFYRFVGEFDAYVLSEGLTPDDAYSDGVDLFRNLFLSAYRDGVADGSVRALPGDPEIFYYSSAHALLGLCKSLSAPRDIVPQDSQTDKLQEVDEMKRIILFYLAAPQSDAENQ